MKKLYIFAAALFLTTASYSQVVISQVYGAGGNNGAVLNRDYVELFNRGTSDVNMTGWSIQYNSATGTNPWNFNLIPDGATIQPGKYYLIAFGAAGANGAAIPTPDFDSTASPLTLSGTTGKLILANIATAIPAGGCPANGSIIVDAVSFGPTATCAEGEAPAPIISSTLADFRNSGGCIDTNNNGADFTAAEPAPRNSSTPVNNCSLGTSQNSIAGLQVYPNPVTNGNLFITSDNNASKAVAIYDVLGKMVIKATVTDQPINVSNLKGGVYIVKITEEGKTATRKLVIR
jgi:hypothetical protein